MTFLLRQKRRRKKQNDFPCSGRERSKHKKKEHDRQTEREDIWPWTGDMVDGSCGRYNSLHPFPPHNPSPLAHTTVIIT
jgi:hypothetical protein